MAVPGDLLQNAHVFCYSSDLSVHTTRLKDALGCGRTNIYGTAPLSNYSGKKIAWLVGHGSEGDTIVGTRVSREGVCITNIIADLASKGYTHIVDTCCKPNLRRTVETDGLSYYCTEDGYEVDSVNTTLDAWWDDNKMKCIR